MKKLALLFATLVATVMYSQSENECGAKDQHGKWHVDSDCDGVTDDGLKIKRSSSASNKKSSCTNCSSSGSSLDLAWAKYNLDKDRFEEEKKNGKNQRANNNANTVFNGFNTAANLVNVYFNGRLVERNISMIDFFMNQSKYSTNGYQANIGNQWYNPLDLYNTNPNWRDGEVVLPGNMNRGTGDYTRTGLQPLGSGSSVTPDYTNANAIDLGTTNTEFNIW